MRRCTRPLVSLLLAGLAGQPALAGAPSDAGSGPAEADRPAVRVDNPASEPAGALSILVTKPGEGFAVSRAADGEGAPVSAVALSPPGDARAATRYRRGGTVSSGFGYRIHPLSGTRRFHAGIDLARPAGTAIIAGTDGTVVYAGWASGYGLLVTIDHGRGVQTRYGHLSSLAVRAGQRVHRGDILGSVGSTGRSTGPHLHYEVRLNGQPVSPLPAKKAN